MLPLLFSSFSLALFSVILLLLLLTSCSSSHVHAIYPEDIKLQVSPFYPFPKAFNGYNRPILSRATLGSNWHPECIIDRFRSPLMDVINTDTCFVLSEYSDQVFFEFGADTEFSQYDFEEPEVKVTTESDANKNARSTATALTTFDYDLGTLKGSFNVHVLCPKTSEAELTFHKVRVSFPYANDEEIVFAFVKICSGGDHPHANFGLYFPIISGAGAGWITNPIKFKNLTQPITYQSSFNLYLVLDILPNIGYQTYGTIEAKPARKDIVEVTTRGNFVQGLISPYKMMNWSSNIVHVIHECRSLGNTTITISVPIPPFNDLTGTYTKFCYTTTKGAPTAVRIMHSLAKNLDHTLIHPVDVYIKGKTNNSIFFTTIHDIKKRLNNTNIYTVPANIPYFEGVFVNQHTEISINNTFFIDKVTVSIVDTRIPKRNLIYASVQEQNIPKVSIRAGNSVTFRINLICLVDEPRIPVLVTVFVKGYNRIDFGFIKTCKKPKSIKHKTYLLTAGRLMFLMIAAMSIVAAYAMYLLLKSENENKKVAPIRSTEPTSSISILQQDQLAPGPVRFMRLPTSPGASTLPS